MASERHRPWRRPGLVGPRLIVLLSLTAAAFGAFLVLGLKPAGIWPGPEGWRLATEFFGHAWRPAFTHQAPLLPPDTPPLLWQVLAAAARTVAFAAAAMPLSILLGLGLGFGGSTVWWLDDLDQASPGRRRRWFWLAAGISAGCRLLAAGMRSVHELLWAVLLLAALGVTPLAAIVALTLPYGGTLAKVFGEMIDEAPRAAPAALAEAGTGPLVVFAFARLPLALPDMIAYAMYRFECGLRSAAVLGFFGFPTLGYHLAASFENLLHAEVWTYLYAMLLLVAAVDWWSGSVRRRLGV